MSMHLSHRKPRTGGSMAMGIGAACLALSMTACTQQKPEELLASAKVYLAKHDRKAAIIQIKNALQASPESAEARFLLGAALLEQGDAGQAEVELQKAARLGYPPDLLVPKRVAALMARAEPQKAIEEFASVKLTSATARAELATELAKAHAAVGNLSKTEADLAAALSADPTYEPALLLQARLEIDKQHLPHAAELADAILKRSPSSPDAWRLKGDIESLTSKDSVAALASYRKAVSLQDDYLPGHLSIVRALVQDGKLDDAGKQIDILKRFAPNNFRVRYNEALLSHLRKDTKAAKEQAALLLRTAPDNVSVLVLAARIELETNALAQAQTHLARALGLAGDNATVRGLLMSAYLRTGQPDQALDVLFRGKSDKNVDPQLYSVAGDAYLLNGDTKTAQDYFGKAAQRDPNDLQKRSALALARLRAGDSGGLDELQSVSAADNGTYADKALISAYLTRNQVDKALAAIDVLERKQPGQPLAPYYRGRAQMALGNPAAARASFERALTLAPKYFPAVASLTALDAAERKLPDAKARLTNFLAADPKHSGALIALAEVEEMAGASKEQTAAALTKAVEADPTNPTPRLMLIDVHARAGEAKQAMTVARAAVSAVPDNAILIAALGEAELRAGEVNQAIAAFSKVVDLRPGAPQPYFWLARAQVANKAKADAEQSLVKAISKQTDFLDAQRMLASLYVDTGRVPAALKIARTIQSQRPKESAGYGLEADIQIAANDPKGAVAALRTGVRQVPSTELAVKLHKTLASSASSSDADRFASEWQRTWPRDVGFIFYLGDSALHAQDFKSARALYEAALKIQPNNAAAFNNLAWIANATHEGDAVTLAENANRLAPRQPAFMDTLATVLAGAGRYDEAIKVERAAIDLQPGNDELQLALAKLYLRSGDRANARSHLNQLATLGDRFPGQAEVAKLLSE